MTKEQLLIQKFHSLNNKNLEEHYDLLESANIIYQLFLDSPSLFDTVNQKYKYKLSFKFEKYKGDSTKDGQIYKMIATIAVIGNPNSDKLEPMNRNNFFKCAALRHGGKDISVSELIIFYRNTKGGTHTSPNKKSIEKGHLGMKRLSELLQINDKKVEGYDSIMKKVTISVIGALKPFIAERESKNK